MENKPPPPSPSVEHFGVGTTDGPPTNTTHSILDEFDSVTYQRYFDALGNAESPTHRFAARLVELNFQSYLNHEKFAGTLIGLGRSFSVGDKRPLIESVTTQIINWLASFRLYLDYAETGLKRQFGRDSSQYLSFKRRTANAYDNHRGYRFIYKFRNYVQHCGPPIASLRVSRSEQRETNPFVKQTAVFLLDRDGLLHSFDEWGPVRKDLLAMQPEFELRTLAHESMEQLRGIESVLLDIAITEGARTIGDLREALSRLPVYAKGAPTLYRFTTNAQEPSTTVQLTPTLFSPDMVEQYERVASGAIQPTDLHARARPPAQPLFDPATVEQHFRRDSRAVQAMSLWQAQGGGTPAFFSGVNSMIQEDRGVDLLLTGMFNMTAILMHMTAAALGVRPDGLLGGLLDVYAAQTPDNGNLDPAAG